MSLNMQEMKYTCSVPITFYSDKTSGNVSIEEINGRYKENYWTGFNMLLKMDYETYCGFEHNYFFCNKPENRLAVLEGGFNPELDIYAEISLNHSFLIMLPAPMTEFPWQTFLSQLDRDSPLCQESNWHGIAFWEEFGSIKVGYQTIFSEPESQIDLIKRKGSVTRLIVTAIIENYIPVEYDEDNALFTLNVNTDEGIYKAVAIPNESDGKITFKVWRPGRVLLESLSCGKELCQQINSEINTGIISIEDGHFTHCHEIMPPHSPESYSWFVQALLEGAGLIRRYSPLFSPFTE